MTHYYTDNSSLASNRKQFDYYFDNESFRFVTDNGVFSKDNVDYGSYLLIKNVYRRALGQRLLDLGCGYGPVGIILARFNPSAEIWAVDVNSRATELAEVNAKINRANVQVLLCEDISTLHTVFDSIILNPPIRAGKRVIFDLYEKSHSALSNGGHLYIVIQKKQGADSSIKRLKEIFSEVRILDRDSGYVTIEAVR